MEARLAQAAPIAGTPAGEHDGHLEAGRIPVREDVRVLGGVPGAMLNRIREGGTSPYAYLLWLRYFLINAAAFALLGAAWMQGWVEMVVKADNTGLSIVIFVAFLGGVTLSGLKVFQTSRELNSAKELKPPQFSKAARYLELIAGRSADSRAICASTLKIKLSSRVAVVRNIGNSLVVLGLIGTVIGFIIALSGVDPETVSDVKAVAPMVSTLIQGMSVALYTTLVGAILNIWLMVNYHILASGTARLITNIIELGESHAGA